MDLERWIEDGELRIGYRADALPFSYDRNLFPTLVQPQRAGAPEEETDWGSATGFSISICKKIVETINEQRSEIKDVVSSRCSENDPDEKGRCSYLKDRLNDEVRVKLFPVTTKDRFERLESGEIDMLCGATSVTLERTKRIDFSLFTFLSSATFAYRTDPGLSTMSDLVGKRIGVIPGSSSSSILPEVLASAKISESQVTLIDSIEDYREIGYDNIGYQHIVDLLSKTKTDKNGQLSYDLDVFFADREILLFVLARIYESSIEANPGFLTVSNLSFSFEPYALAFGRQNPLLRYYANKTLANLFRDRQIDTLINGSFQQARKSTLLQALYKIQQISLKHGRYRCKQAH